MYNDTNKYIFHVILMLVFILAFAQISYGSECSGSLELQNRSNVNDQDLTAYIDKIAQKTPLMQASTIGDIDFVQKSINLGNNIDLQDHNEMTALMYAVREGHIDIAKVLIDAGADVTIENWWGGTALIYAAQNGYFEIVQALIEAGDINVKHRTKWGGTALVYAAKAGYLHIARLLIATGADEPHQDTSRRRTDLMWAVLNGYTGTVEALIKAGVDVNRESKNGFKALDYAYHRDSNSTIRRLLKEAGATENGKNGRINTLTHALRKLRKRFM